jgi:hypothetical protein
MADNSNTLQLTISVKDDGTIVIDKAAGKIKDLEGETQKTTTTLESMSQGWMAITAKIGIATAAFYAAKRMIYDTAKEIASQNNDIERQAEVLGISTDELQKWQYAAKMSDVNIHELALGIKLLSRNLEDASQGTGDASKYFSMMEISVKDTTGNLRPLNEMMGDIMDKFASWEDGPRKIAIAMALFGRSGETLIPLLNRGRTGFAELSREADKLGIILNSDVINKGSQAEDIFKKLDIQINTTKLSMAPFALEAAKMIDSMMSDFNKLDKWLKENKTTDWFPWLKDINKWMQENSLKNWFGGPETNLPDIANWFGQQRMPEAAKKKPPPLPEDPEKVKKRLQEELELRSKVYELTAIPYTFPTEAEEAKMILQSLEEELKIRTEIAEKRLEAEKKINAEIEKMGLGFEAPTEEYKLKLLEQEAALRTEIADKRLEAEKKINAEIERVGLGFEAPTEEYKIAHLTRQATEWETAWKGAVEGVNSVWVSNFSIMRRSGEDFGDWFKNAWLDMADYAIGQIQKIAINYALMGNISGKYEAGKGLLGLIGGLFSSAGGIVAGTGAATEVTTAGMFMAQEGFSGWVNRPTLFLAGEGGRRESVSITPESKMVGSGDTYNSYYIDARGAQKGVSTEILRALRETENRAVKRSVNKVADLKLRGGKFGKIFE